MLTDPTFWRDLTARVVRQVIQTILPVLSMVAITGAIGGLDWTGLAVAAALSALVTLLRALTGVRVADHAATWLQALDRGLAAAAGTALGLVTAEGFDLLHADYGAIGGAAVASGCLAVLAVYTNNPVPPLAPAIEPQTDAPDPLAPAVQSQTLDDGSVIYDYSAAVDTTGDEPA